jgi:hypothetical protein
MPSPGLEQLLETSGKTQICTQGGAGSGALSGAVGSGSFPQFEPRLTLLIEAWDTLPEVVRSGIVAMVDSVNTDLSD